MSKQQYRSEMGIISAVLRVVMEYGNQGTIISSIARNANLSHYTALEKCQKLVGFGLMESVVDNKNRTFVITEKGILFFHEMQKFIELVESVKIRY